MAYFFLALALAGGLAKGLTGKRVSCDVKSIQDSVAVTLIPSVFSAIIGFFIAAISAFASGNGLSGFALTPAAFPICRASSFFVALFSISWQYAYKSEAYIFLNIFTMLGAVITAILGRIVYDEPLRFTRILGFVLLFCAVYIVSLYNKKLTGKITRRGAAALLLGVTGASLGDFMQKVYAHKIGANGSVFTFYTYAMMLIPMLAVLLVCKKSGKAPSKVLFDRWHIYAFLLISLGLYVNSFTKVLAARLMPATQMYPTLQGANLIASATMASLLFKERITWRSALGILIAIAAVILMNMA